MADEKDMRHWRRRLENLEAERRRGWESHWRDLARHFLPRRSRFLASGEETNRGERRNFLFDGAGILARRTLSAGMQTGLTSPARPWFSLTLQDESLAQSAPVKLWLHAVYERMVNVFAQSNFYDQVHLLYDELGTFGVGATLIEEDVKSVIRCRTLTAGEYCLDVDAAGRVDRLYRRVRMSPRQTVQAWPGSAPERIKRLAEADNADWLDVVHVIEPARGSAPGSAGRGQAGGGPDRRPWRSVYFLLEGRADEILEDSGYYEFPALCPRWNTTASDVYGSSPAMDALGDCRMLQKLAEDGLDALEKEVKPPLVAPQNAGLTKYSLAPGAINYVSPLSGGGPPAVTPLIQVRANLAALEQYKAALKQQIRETFFNDLFLMLSQVNRQMTATEVAERNAEKMLMLGPVLDRLRSELFQPLIERVFWIMWRRGDIPPAPPEVAESGQGLKVEFISLLAQAQKQAGLTAISQTVGFAAALAQLAPVAPAAVAALDKLDFDEALEEVAEMNGVPPKLLRGREEVAALRAQREEEMAQAKQMAVMNQMAGLAREGAGALKDAGTAGQALSRAEALQAGPADGEQSGR